MADPARQTFTRERIVTILSPIVILVAWEVLARMRVIDVRYVPAPSTILLTAAGSC
jgi:ABC-type nitrate/sulfonate/bicarbonate transport system permease component